MNKEVNPNHYVRHWLIIYRKSKWNNDEKEEVRLEGNFIDVLHKLNEIGRKDIYTDFIIKDLD